MGHYWHFWKWWHYQKTQKRNFNILVMSYGLWLTGIFSKMLTWHNIERWYSHVNSFRTVLTEWIHTVSGNITNRNQECYVTSNKANQGCCHTCVNKINSKPNFEKERQQMNHLLKKACIEIIYQICKDNTNRDWI